MNIKYKYVNLFEKYAFISNKNYIISSENIYYFKIKNNISDINIIFNSNKLKKILPRENRVKHKYSKWVGDVAYILIPCLDVGT